MKNDKTSSLYICVNPEGTDWLEKNKHYVLEGVEGQIAYIAPLSNSGRISMGYTDFLKSCRLVKERVSDRMIQSLRSTLKH